MKKIGIIFLIMIILGTLSVSTASAQYIIGTNINVQLLNQDPDPVEPGKYVEVRLKVENNGGEAAKNFVFELLPGYPFSLDPGTNSKQYLGKVDSYQVGDNAYVVYYRVKVDQDAVDGQYDLDYRYSPDNGASWREGSDSIRIEDTDYLIGISNVNTIPSKVAPGQDVNLDFEISNLASSAITDIQIALTLERVDTATTSVTRTELPFSPVGTSDKQIIESINAGKSEKVNFNLAVDADAESRVHKIPITITYNNNQGTQYSKDFMIGIIVFETPHYLINLESTEIYKNNQKGNVVVSISNTGVGKMNFLTISLSSSNDYKILSSDKIYLGNLDSDDFETADFDLYTNSDKEEIPLMMNLVFKDEFNNEYSVNEEVNLQLYSSKEAVRFGFEDPKNSSNIIIMGMVFLLLSVFWLFMLVDAVKHKNEEKWKRIIWIAMIILTYVIGAIIYYLFGRKKKNIGGD